MRGRAGVARIAAVACCLTALGLAACGGERQDKNEPRGTYEVRVDASFPQAQKLAKRSELEIAVQNVDDKTVPNVTVTIEGFDRRDDAEGLAARDRPVFAINGGPIQNLGGFPDSKADAPKGGDTAYVDTWALGQLRPGRTKTFRWSVTAVHPGPFRLSYVVSAGLDGKAKAVTPGGQKVTGRFTGTIEGDAPVTRVGDDGQTIVRGTR